MMNRVWVNMGVFNQLDVNGNSTVGVRPDVTQEAAKVGRPPA